MILSSSLSYQPFDLRSILLSTNGFIWFGGGLQVRGASQAPSWHSLRTAWLGLNAFHRHCASLSSMDVPFGQETTGDQFVLRDGSVHRLSAETDELDALGLSLEEFLDLASQSPVDTLLLHLHPLLGFREQGGIQA